MARVPINLPFLVPPCFAQGERPVEFDRSVLSLGWSPNCCALEGDARNDDGRPGRVHGWP